PELHRARRGARVLGRPGGRDRRQVAGPRTRSQGLCRLRRNQCCLRIDAVNIQTPVRLSGAEESLVAQLESIGATDAAERLRVIGWPTRRVEPYHYTDLKPLLGQVPPLAKPAESASAPAIDIPGAYRIVIGNGIVQAAATAPSGVIVGKTAGSVLT